MDHYTHEEVRDALREVTSTITKCEKAQCKFVEGTSQYSLLRNRIKAMYISKLLIENELSKLEQTSVKRDKGLVSVREYDNKNVMEYYSKKELKEALPPVVSVINKCEKAKGKFEEGSTHYKRFKKLIMAMHISKSLIEEQLPKMD